MVLSALALSLALSAAAPASGFTADDFRIYCGFLDEVAKEENKSLSEKKQLAKISKLAKVSSKQLQSIIKRGGALGATCEDVAKGYETKAKAALGGTPLEARVQSFQLDVADPTHVVAYVSWKGEQKKKLEEEAALVAWAVAQNAPIVTTLNVRAVDPLDGETSIFEGKISADRMSRIDRGRIDSFSDSMYVKWFDGVKVGGP